MKHEEARDHPHASQSFYSLHNLLYNVCVGERRTGQTKFFWHEAFRNKMPWEVNFGRLEVKAGTNRKTQIRASASVLANTLYVLPQVECADARRDDNSLSSQSLLLSREHTFSHPFILLFLSFFGRASHYGCPLFF